MVRAGAPADIYMSNHQSHLDIPMLYASLPSGTIRMLAKKALFQIPIWAALVAVRVRDHGCAPDFEVCVSQRRDRREECPE